MATAIVGAKLHTFIGVLVWAFEVFRGIALKANVGHAAIAPRVVASTSNCEM